MAFLSLGMIQKAFADHVVTIIKPDENVIGLAVGGSWLRKELDEFSDLDLILVTKEKINDDKAKMIKYARSFGDFISGFTGEHVGEPRLLICLYDNPLLHVDIKFLTLPELKERVEDPEVLFERGNKLSNLISSTKSGWPPVDFQWIEDRFWTWVHYTATKIGRGEFFDALSAIDYFRVNVLSRLMQFKNKTDRMGIRKVEARLSAPDLEDLKITVAQYNKTSLIKSLENTIAIYKSLRRKLFPESINLQERAEKTSLAYLKTIKKN